MPKHFLKHFFIHVLLPLCVPWGHPSPAAAGNWVSWHTFKNIPSTIAKTIFPNQLLFFYIQDFLKLSDIKQRKQNTKPHFGT